MLTLTRLFGEKIYIGENIVIQVGLIERDKVRIAIDAPRDLLIEREEVRRARLAQSQHAAG